MSTDEFVPADPVPVSRSGPGDRDDRLAPAEAWEHFEALVQAWVLSPRRSDVNDALYACEAAVMAGERPTSEDVREARRALDSARALVEDTYAALDDDVEPWGEGAGSMVPYNVFVEQLEAAGYTVYRPGEEPVDLSEVHGEA